MSDAFVPPDGYEDAFVPPDGYEEQSKQLPPTRLQKTADAITKVLRFVDNPGGQDMSGVNTMAAQGDALFKRMGEATTEGLGRVGVPPVLSAGAGTLVSMVNPQNWMTPAPKPGMQHVIDPTVTPPDLASTGVPFTRAELTGTRGASQLEAGLDKTPTGGPVIDKFRQGQKAAIENFIQKLLGKHGTSAPDIAQGMTIREAANAEKEANTATNDALYNKLPYDTRVPHTSFVKLYKELEGSISAKIRRLVRGKDIQVDENPVRPGDVGTSGTPEPSNASKGIFNKPEAEPGEVVRPGDIQYHTEPGKPTQLSNAPTLKQLKLLRTELGAEAAKGGVDGFHAGALRDAITRDIENLAKNGSVLDKFVGKDAADSFRTATSYNREMRTLYEHPVAQKLLDATISKTPDVIFGRGFVEDVQVGRAVLGEVGFKAAQKSFYTDLLHSRDIGKVLGNLDGEFLKQALTSDQLSSLKLLDKVKKTALGAERSTPMTGSSRMNAALGSTGVVGTAIALAAKGHVAAAIGTLVTGLGLPYATAKIYLQQAQGFLPYRAPVAQAGGMAVRSLANQNQPRTKMDVLRGYVQKQRQGPG